MMRKWRFGVTPSLTWNFVRRSLCSIHRSKVTSIIWENPHHLHDYIQQNLHEFTAGDIATIFFTSAKRKFKLDSKDIFDMAKVLEKKDPIRPLSLANILNGLRIHTTQDPAVMYLLTVLKTKLDHLESEMPPHLIALSLFGFKQMNNNPHTLSVIESLTSRMEASPSYTIPPSEFGNTLIGLQNFTSEDSRIISLLESLQFILEPYHPSSATKQMTARSLAQSLYGLKGMSWNHQVVRNLYQLLLPHMVHCTEPFDRVQLGAAFYSLQKYSEKDSLSLDILTVLEKKLCEVSFSLDGTTIGSVLYGLQNLSSNSPIVLSLLRNLTPFIYSLPKDEKISSHSLGSALYGLRNMSNNVKEVMELVMALESLIPRCTQLQERQGSIMLIGLRRMNSDQPSIRKFLEFIYFIFVETSSIKPVPFSSPSPIIEGFSTHAPIQLTSRILQNQLSVYFKLSSEVICKCIYSFQCMSSDHVEVLQLLQFLTWRLEINDDFVRSKDIGLSLYGLQRMDPCHPVVRKTLEVISTKIQKRLHDQYLYPYDIESAEIAFNQFRKKCATSTSEELQRLEQLIHEKRREFSQVNRY